MTLWAVWSQFSWRLACVAVLASGNQQQNLDSYKQTVSFNCRYRDSTYPMYCTDTQEIHN